MSARGLTNFYLYIFLVYLIIVIGVSVGLILANRKNELKKLRFWLIVSTGLISILLFIILNSVSFFATSKYCIICHEMKPEYNAWQRSRHKNVECVGCHLNNEGVIGFIFEDLEALMEVKNHVTGNYSKIINKDSSVSQKLMDSRNCIRCHPKSQPTFVFGSNIRMDHKEHTETGVSCPTCHNRVTHRGARGFNYLDGVRMMDGCIRCHMPGAGRKIRGEKAPTECSTCHLDKNIGQKAFGKKSIDKFDLRNCEACHKLSDPKAVGEFKKSKMFTKAGLTCESCHQAHDSKKFNPRPDPKVCNDCHKEFSKKVAEKEHGEEVKNSFKKASEVKCSFCHKPHAFLVPNK